MDIIKPPRSWAQYARQIVRLFPCHCRICGQINAELLCESCFAKLEYDEHCCVQCGELLPTPHGESLVLDRCGHCIAQPPPFERTVFAYRYSGPMVELIHQFKFSEQLILGRLLADMIVARMQEQMSGNLPDALISVPLHPSRLKERGFNQSHELARHIGKALDIPVYKNVLIRKRATSSQSGLSKAARRRNIQGAFELSRKANKSNLEGKHLGLIDDVITTGSTTISAAKTLRRTAPGNVCILATARTQKALGR